MKAQLFYEKTEWAENASLIAKGNSSNLHFQ